MTKKQDYQRKYKRANRRENRLWMRCYRHKLVEILGVYVRWNWMGLP